MIYHQLRSLDADCLWDTSGDPEALEPWSLVSTPCDLDLHFQHRTFKRWIEFQGHLSIYTIYTIFHFLLRAAIVKRNQPNLMYFGMGKLSLVNLQSPYNFWDREWANPNHVWLHRKHCLNSVRNGLHALMNPPAPCSSLLNLRKATGEECWRSL